MSLRWKIVIETWPHTTGKGVDADQALCGERERYFYVDAEDIRDALKLGLCISEGICSNPAVWLAPITAIGRYRP